MSKGTVNKMIILGHLGADPEIRYDPNGGAVATLRVATNEGYKDKTTGQFIEKTEWHRIVLFKKLAEIADQYLQKGSLAYFEGRIQTKKWRDKVTGQDKYMTEVIAFDMKMIGTKSENTSESIESKLKNPFGDDTIFKEPADVSPAMIKTSHVSTPAPGEKLDINGIPF